MIPSTNIPSSSRSSIEERQLLGHPPMMPTPSSSAIAPMDLLRSMSVHTETIRTPLSTKPADPHCLSPATTSSSRRGSDIESGGSEWSYAIFSKRRRTRRTTYLLIAVILSSGLIYTFIDNFLLADWVSARSRFTPTYLGGQGQDLINVPDIPDAELSAETWMGKGVVRIPDDEGHVIVPNPSTLPTYNLLAPIQRYSSSLLVPYYATGHLPLEPLPHSAEPTVDIVYTFVNASSPVLQEAKDMRAEKEGLGRLDGASRHWRDNGELRGAIRSAAQHFADGLRKVHVISADFELDSVRQDSTLESIDDGEAGVEQEENIIGEEDQSRWRVGQVPSWLDTTAGEMGLQWHFHSEIFRLPSDHDKVDSRTAKDWISEDRWRDLSLPSFNSFQIESKVGWVKDISENFILSNDDMFFLRDLSPADFHHPLLGPVFRLAPDLGLRVPPTLLPILKSDPGEWGGLQHANQLISNRFYSKARMYMSHVPKSMTRSLVHEASIMFSRELAVAATRGFRESKRGKADVHFAWLVTHLQIERWREALLWSWAVARLGGEEGMWGDDAREDLWGVLGLTGTTGPLPEEVVVIQNERTTLDDMDLMMDRNDMQFPEASEYLFTSMDGHLPHMPSNEPVPESCVFSLTTCLPSGFFTNSSPISATDMFTRLTFIQPGCGDCLIMALINASRPRGLSAILPHADQTFEPEVRERSEWEREEPMLPLVSTWYEGNFSLNSVVRPGQDHWTGESGDLDRVKLREFCVKLLSRYTYSVAISPTHFALSRSPVELVSVLDQFNPSKNLAMGCLNDDQPDWATGESAEILGTWMEGRFGGWEAGWEKKDFAWTHNRQSSSSVQENSPASDRSKNEEIGESVNVNMVKALLEGFRGSDGKAVDFSNVAI